VPRRRLSVNRAAKNNAPVTSKHSVPFRRSSHNVLLDNPSTYLFNKPYAVLSSFTHRKDEVETDNDGDEDIEKIKGKHRTLKEFFPNDPDIFPGNSLSLVIL